MAGLKQNNQFDLGPDAISLFATLAEHQSLQVRVPPAIRKDIKEDRHAKAHEARIRSWLAASNVLEKGDGPIDCRDQPVVVRILSCSASGVA